jgi:hypothetical protein
VVNVRTFGVRGDGHTDDAEAIRRALVVGSGNAVYFPVGIYAISRPLDLPSASMRIFGDGASSVLLQRSDNLGIFNILPGSRGIELDHLHFRESGTVHGYQLGRGALYINPGGRPPAVSKLYIHDNIFDCASTSCIAATYLVNSRIQRNRFDNDGTGEHGVYLSSDGNYNSRDVVIESNIFHSSYRGGEGQNAIELGIQLRATKDVSIINNRITGWSDGILTIPEQGRLGAESDVSGLTIRGNMIESQADDGFVNFDGAVKYAIVEDNTFTTCGRNGIRSNSPLEESLFARNKVLNSGESGIRLNFVAHSIFSDNIVQDSGRLARDGPDSTSGIRLNDHNYDDLFIGNTSTISSAGSAQQFGVSIAGSAHSVANLRNCFAANRLLPNAKREMDTYEFKSDCSKMTNPPTIHVTLTPSAAMAGRQVRIINENRVPLRILNVKTSGGVTITSRNCGRLVAAGSGCNVTVVAPGASLVLLNQENRCTHERISH